MKTPDEIFVSVDIEAAGPVPGEYSMLSIGACLVYDDSQTFSSKLKPITRNADPKAMEIAGLTLDDLEREGTEPVEAMREFKEWILSICGEGTPVFVGFNASFDWSFINYYFHRFLGSNPFGFSSLDIKALYMGATGCTWKQTSSNRMAQVLHPLLKGNHNALKDAQYQAELFRLVRQPKRR